ncbi:MAG: YqaJ viral recombinase family protein [Lachnospiraceae bacterium]|nr:YqaJ viral recombinase family protein [Lachnospiraceae bacterium]
MVICKDITKITNEEWLALRKKGIGGSDAPKILGLSSFMSPLELYWNKTGQRDFFESKNTFVAKEVGHLLEPLVARIFEEKNPGWKVYKDNRMITHPLYSFMLADIDFYTIDPNTGEKFIVECKTTNANTLERKWGKPTDTKYPREYEWQCRHYMAVHEVAGTILICLGGNTEADYRQRVIMRDHDKERFLIEKEKEFWDMVVNKTPPKPQTSKPIAQHYEPREDEGLVIETALIATYHNLETKKKNLNRYLKSIEEEEEVIKAQIFDYLKGRPAEVEYDGLKYKARITETTSVGVKSEDLPNLRLEYPEVYEKYVKSHISHSCGLKRLG